MTKNMPLLVKRRNGEITSFCNTGLTRDDKLRVSPFGETAGFTAFRVFCGCVYCCL